VKARLKSESIIRTRPSTIGARAGSSPASVPGYMMPPQYYMSSTPVPIYGGFGVGVGFPQGSMQQVVGIPMGMYPPTIHPPSAESMAQGLDDRGSHEIQQFPGYPQTKTLNSRHRRTVRQHQHQQRSPQELAPRYVFGDGSYPSDVMMTETAQIAFQTQYGMSPDLQSVNVHSIPDIDVSQQYQLQKKQQPRYRADGQSQHKKVVNEGSPGTRSTRNLGFDNTAKSGAGKKGKRVTENVRSPQYNLDNDFPVLVPFASLFLLHY